jgi:hypothetical protein
MEVLGAADGLGIKGAKSAAQRFDHVVEGRTTKSK